MKFQRLIEAVYFQPWSITRSGWSSIHALLKPRLLKSEISNLKSEFPDLDSEDKDIWGNPMPKMEILYRVAHIPIIGPLIHHAGLIEKKCGACSYDDVRRDVAAALNTAGLQAIVFEVNSPGGQCVGCCETAAVIDDARRLVRTEARTDSQMCSAAYDLMCGCDRIICTPSAQVGSIGALLAWLDESVRYEMEGYKMEVFASGPLKGTGMEGTAFTPAQRDYLQSQVDKYAGMFKTHVRSHRLVEDIDMQGQSFIGTDALLAGLVDEVHS